MNNNKMFTGFCRICLQDEAKIPIFEMETEQKNVFNKLLLCVNEKVEDIDGYPRFICSVCSQTLDTICEFIHKFKESCKRLEKHLLSGVKEEIQENYDQVPSDCDTQSEPEIHDVKIEFEQPADTLDFVDANNKDFIIVEKPERIKKKRKFIPRRLRNVKTNNVASSILEGVFNWTGERWCLSSALKEPVVAQETAKGRRPKLKLKLKKAKGPRPGKLCDLCGEVFKTSDKLRIHKLKVHLPKDMLKCPIENCRTICNSKYNLSRHVNRKHTDNKNFTCNECGRRFAYKAEMNSHMKIHNREKYPKKLFSCKYCDKTYKCQKSVDIHERSAHTGMRPAVCSVCNAAFFHEEYLKQHMMLHTGETPFKCPVCGRGYAQRGNMKSHLRIHRISDLDAATLQKIKPTYLKLLKV